MPKTEEEKILLRIIFRKRRKTLFQKIEYTSAKMLEVYIRDIIGRKKHRTIRYKNDKEAIRKEALQLFEMAKASKEKWDLPSGRIGDRDSYHYKIETCNDDLEIDPPINERYRISPGAWNKHKYIKRYDENIKEE